MNWTAHDFFFDILWNTKEIILLVKSRIFLVGYLVNWRISLVMENIIGQAENITNVKKKHHLVLTLVFLQVFGRSPIVPL